MTTEKSPFTDLENDVRQLKDIVWTLIAWMSQASNGPLSKTDATILLQRLSRLDK